jgi:hypothetical protein
MVNMTIVRESLSQPRRYVFKLFCPIRNLEVKSLFFVQGFLTQRTRSTQRGEMPSFVTLVTFVLKPFWFWLVQVRIVIFDVLHRQ